MGLFGTSARTSFPWTPLVSTDQLENVLNESEQRPVLLFKHSTRCSISAMVLNRFQEDWSLPSEDCGLYYLDLLQHREVSNAIENMTGVVHQSPQVILLHNRQVIYDASHHHISAQAISQKIKL